MARLKPCRATRATDGRIRIRFRFCSLTLGNRFPGARVTEIRAQRRGGFGPSA